VEGLLAVKQGGAPWAYGCAERHHALLRESLS